MAAFGDVIVIVAIDGQYIMVAKKYYKILALSCFLGYGLVCGSAYSGLQSEQSAQSAPNAVSPANTQEQNQEVINKKLFENAKYEDFAKQKPVIPFTIPTQQ